MNNILDALKNIDWNIVLIAEYFAIDYFSKKILSAKSKTKNNKYALQIDNGFIENIIEIELPPELKINYRNINFRELLEKEFGNTISRFAQIMIDNFSSKDLINFFNNVNELVLEKKEKTVNNNFVASYIVKKNKISLYENYQKTSLPHELFHMSSSFYEPINKIEYCGFSIDTVINENSLKRIGDGINEGYTEYIVEKYYGEKYIEKSNYNYELLRQITKTIEDVVGKNKMEHLYLNANLRGLISELSIYMEEKDILNFINYTDYIYTNLNIKEKTEEEKQKLTIALRFVNEFLSKLYFRSAAKKYKEEEIIYSEFKSMILKGCFSFHLTINDYQYDIALNNKQYIEYAVNACKDYGIKNIDIELKEEKSK